MIKPIYQEISEKLKEYIRERGITGKLPGTRQLSKELGCHHVTLSKAIHLLEQDGLLEICGNQGVFVSSSLKPQRPVYRVLALVDGMLETPAGRRVLSDMNALLKNAGYSMIGIRFNGDLFHENPRLLLNFPVDGFLFRYSTLLFPQAELLDKEGIPMVSSVRQFGMDTLDQSDCDHEKGYSIILQRLVARGHRRIGWVEYGRIPEYQPYLKLIRRCFQSCLGQYFDPALLYIRETNVECYEKYAADCSEIYVRRAVEYFLKLPEPPTAIIVPSQGFCTWLCKVFSEKNIRIPEDMTVVCVNHGASLTVSENIPVVYYKEEEMLLWGLNRLVQRLQDPDWKPVTKLFPPQFFQWQEDEKNL